LRHAELLSFYLRQFFYICRPILKYQQCIQSRKGERSIRNTRPFGSIIKFLGVVGGLERRSFALSAVHSRNCGWRHSFIIEEGGICNLPRGDITLLLCPRVNGRLPGRGDGIDGIIRPGEVLAMSSLGIRDKKIIGIPNVSSRSKYRRR
jgi:hypothetical protein